MKSSNKNIYERWLRKWDDILGYAGGLIGIVAGLFFMMAPYTQISY